MRQLLVAAFGLLFAGPAMAVDYVKCEAMQKALERADNAETAMLEKVMDEYGKVYCSTNDGPFCSSRGMSVYEKEISTDERLKPFSAKVKKIKADLKKASCP